MKTGWTDFKSYHQSTGISMHYIATKGSGYRVFCVNGSFSVECLLIHASTDYQDFETNFKANSNKSITKLSPFASKVNDDGKKLYKRVHGIQQAVIDGVTVINFTVPYTHCKMTALELINGNVLDKADLEVYDRTTNPYLGVPDAKLNQFGYATNMRADFHSQVSEFDSDLYSGMIIRITLTTSVARTVGVNYILNEVI